MESRLQHSDLEEPPQPASSMSRMHPVLCGLPEKSRGFSERPGTQRSRRDWTRFPSSPTRLTFSASQGSRSIADDSCVAVWYGWTSSRRSLLWRGYWRATCRQTAGSCRHRERTQNAAMFSFLNPDVLIPKQHQVTPRDKLRGGCRSSSRLYAARLDVSSLFFGLRTSGHFRALCPSLLFSPCSWRARARVSLV